MSHAYTLSSPLVSPEFRLGCLPRKLEVLFVNHVARDKKMSPQPCSAGPANATITPGLPQTRCKGAGGKLWQSAQIQLALLVARFTHPAHAASHCSCCWVSAQEGGKKQEKNKKKKEVTSSNNGPQKANVSYYCAGSFRLFDVTSPTQSCSFHSLFLHTNKMLHVLYVTHPQLLFKAHLSQLTVLCSPYHFSNQYSYIIGTEAFLF